jgi:hypothetical protein
MSTAVQATGYARESFGEMTLRSNNFQYSDVAGSSVKNNYGSNEPA